MNLKMANSEIKISTCDGKTTLTLTNKHNIDISCYAGTVEMLELNDCTGITGIKALGTLSWASVNNCKGLTELSEFTRVSSLDLVGCKDVYDFSAVEGSAIKYITIFDSPKLLDISPLCGITGSIDIQECDNLTTLTPLNNTKARVSINYCAGIQDYSPIEHLKDVQITTY
jgi:hypothetical protein